MQSSFVTQVPSLPGEYSQLCPTFSHAPEAFGAGALLSSGGHARSVVARMKRTTAWRMSEA